jgi:chemotaxis protein CheC
MNLYDYSDLNEIQLDALREIGNIGSGNAATALSQMLDRPVKIAVPRVTVLDYQTVAERLGGPEELMIGLLLTISGDLTGMIMFLLQKEFANMVLSDLLGQECCFDVEDSMGCSAVMEVGNIMAASYVNAIASLTGLRIELSPPSFCMDMVGAILSVPTIYYANISDKIIYIEDEFNNNINHAASHVLLIPEVEALQKMMRSLGLG